MGATKTKSEAMKTPEELAEEYSLSLLPDPRDARLLCSARKDFLAGYQAAKDRLPPFHAGADVYIIDANNPLPKPMPLSIAEQNQFADTSKVMNSPEDPDSCDHILDMEKMVDVNSSNNSNGWISVKDRLPEIGEWVVADSFDCCQRTKPPSNKFESIFVWRTTFNHYLKADAIKWWMPLPELPAAPKEEA